MFSFMLKGQTWSSNYMQCSWLLKGTLCSITSPSPFKDYLIICVIHFSKDSFKD